MEPGFRGVSFVPSMFSTGCLRQDIVKELIWEDILMGIEERQALDEEVRMAFKAKMMMTMRKTLLDDFYAKMMAKTNASKSMASQGHHPCRGEAITDAPFDHVLPPSNFPGTNIDIKLGMTSFNANATPNSKIHHSNENLLGTNRKAEASSKTSKLEKAISDNLEALKFGPEDLSSAICYVNTTSDDSINDHFEGKKHEAKLEAPKCSKTIKLVQAICDEPEGLKCAPEDLSRAICHFKTSEDSLNDHFEGKKHKAKLEAPKCSKTTKLLKAMSDEVEGAKCGSEDLSHTICQVNRTSEDSLNDYFEEKKHESKLEAPKCSTRGFEVTSGETLNDGFEGKKCKAKHEALKRGNKVDSTNANLSPKNMPEIIDIEVNRMMTDQVLRKKKHLLCLICETKCSSEFSMAEHLRGKKHNAMMAKSTRDRPAQKGNKEAEREKPRNA